jgi:hypothetical protein
MWIRVLLNTTEIIASFSANGSSWHTLYTAARDAVIGEITHFGFGCSNKMRNTNEATWQQRFAVRYWEEN